MSLAARYADLGRRVFSDVPLDAIFDEEEDDGYDEDEEEGTPIATALSGVSDRAWTEFVRRMAVAPLSAVSPSNALGMFELSVRRLADLGIVGSLVRTTKDNRTIWCADFIAPMTSDKFLKSAKAQYQALARSMRDYADRIASGEVARDPRISLAGALAILHRGGPSGLKTWFGTDVFPAMKKTKQLYSTVAEIF